MQDVVIVGAVRTAIGKFGGTLASLPAAHLGAKLISDLLAKTGVKPQHIDEVIMGQVLTAGIGQNGARQAALKANLPVEVPATTVNKVCGSGLKAIQLAAQAIRLGESEIVIAGGQENMSAAPHLLPNSRNGVKMGGWTLVDSMIVDGLWDAFHDCHMGCTAENIVDRYGISREEQDAFAAASQQKAEAAQKRADSGTRSYRSKCRSRKAQPSCSIPTSFHGLAPRWKRWRNSNRRFGPTVR